MISTYLRTLFTGQKPMQSTEPTGLQDLEEQARAATERLGELQETYAELQRRESAGEASEDDLMEIGQSRARVLAAQRVRDAAADRFYRAQLEEKRAAARAAAGPDAAELGDLVPRLLWLLEGIEERRAQLEEASVDFEEVLGVPRDFHQRVRDAIHEAAPDAEWDFGFLSGKPSERPRRRPEPGMYLVAPSPDSFHTRY
jgi:hypothetical protein